MYELSSKVSFLWVKSGSFDHTSSEVQNCGGELKRVVQHIVFVVGPSPPTSTSCLTDVIHMVNDPRLSPFFVVLPLPCTILYANQRTKTKGGLGTGLIQYSLVLCYSHGE